MRTAWLSVAAGLVWAGGTRAADFPREGTVTYPSIEIKAGAGWNMANCGTLKKGAQVYVHHEENEFYAILPPEGCQSWINHRFLKIVDGSGERQNAALTVNADVYCGSATGLPTDVKQVSLPKGEIVVLIGPKASFDNSTWHPISPPKNEYRFIIKRSVVLSDKPAVDPSAASGNASLSDSSKGGVPGTLTSRSTQASNIGGGSGVNHALWPQADQAYQNGEYTKAEELYRQVYLDMNKSSDYTYDDKLLCYNRRMKCVEMIASNRSGTGDSGRFDSSGRPLGGVAPQWTGSPSSRSDKPNDGPREVTSKPLVLRKANFTLDGKSAYALVTERGDVAYYATLQQGVNVDSMIGKTVEATGTPKTRGDLGVPFMTVSRVAEAGK